MQFYRSLGGQILREWVTVRVDGEALHSLGRR
jgi:hypothetical protein